MVTASLCHSLSLPLLSSTFNVVVEHRSHTHIVVMFFIHFSNVHNSSLLVIWLHSFSNLVAGIN